MLHCFHISFSRMSYLMPKVTPNKRYKMSVVIKRFSSQHSTFRWEVQGTVNYLQSKFIYTTAMQPVTWHGASWRINDKVLTEREFGRHQWRECDLSQVMLMTSACRWKNKANTCNFKGNSKTLHSLYSVLLYSWEDGDVCSVGATVQKSKGMTAHRNLF